MKRLDTYNNKYFRICIGGILGLFLNYAFVPINSSMILCCVLSLLYYLVLKCESGKECFFLGTCFGFAFFLYNLYWLYYPVKDNSTLWLVACLPLLFLYLGIYYGLVCVVFFFSYWKNIFVFALYIMFAEWLRGHIIIPFPWNILGYTYNKYFFIRQLNYYFGIYILTYFVVLYSLIPIGLIQSHRKYRFVFIFIFITSFLCLLSFTKVYIIDKYLIFESDSDTNIAIVQPGSDCKTYSIDCRRERYYRTLFLTKYILRHYNKIDIIIWPEGVLFDSNIDLQFLGDALLIRGYMRRVSQDMFNSVIFLNSNSDIIAGYDKFHLVPFGEYIPMHGVFGTKNIFLFGLTPGEQSYKYITLDGYDLPGVYTNICYEAIFSDRIDYTMPGRWLLNITNDSFYANSHEHKYHVEMSRIRAIEMGKPMIRAALNGISAIIDHQGTMLHHLEFKQSDYIVEKIPSMSVDSVYMKIYILVHRFICYVSILVIILNYLMFCRNYEKR
ncbi:MAG: apolipoprotein N-acyltransferase [Candidatus Xenolissoclinum pacificiensis L6]|uniref:Apolipoprotein N-acyltransferase n=1 Tax=Candidatus Xenolissoclinum pacificiensis L6 TaxID=1401685 RepID=W2V285_9RICK|nr:MAG: apolipoprotein N-acyltransferase [Candidatus Xenolissoclinum pacificiensis L6]